MRIWLHGRLHRALRWFLKLLSIHFEWKERLWSSETASALVFYPPLCIAVGKLKRALAVPKGHLLASQGQDDCKNNLIEYRYRFRPVKKGSYNPLGKIPHLLSPINCGHAWQTHCWGSRDMYRFKFSSHGPAHHSIPVYFFEIASPPPVRPPLLRFSQWIYGEVIFLRTIQADCSNHLFFFYL